MGCFVFLLCDIFFLTRINPEQVNEPNFQVIFIASQRFDFKVYRLLLFLFGCLLYGGNVVVVAAKLLFSLAVDDILRTLRPE